MKTVVGIGGEPATGKTSLMRQIIEALKTSENPAEFHFKKLVKGTVFNKSKIYIVGDYFGNETFAGTDRLSMAVQPVFLDFLDSLDNYSTVLFEGDRLFNRKSIDFLIGRPDFKCRFYALKASLSETARRRNLRGTDQSETWLKGRKTKTDNLIKAYPGIVGFLYNDNLIDQNNNLFFILSRMSI